MSPQPEVNLEQIVADAVQQALAGGASGAECTISEGEEFSVSVRMREIENLKEAGSRGAGIRVLIGEPGAQRAGSSYTSDLTPDGIRKMVGAALELAKITSVDPFAGLPDRSELGKLEGDLGLYDEAIERMTTEWKIDQALRAEKAALDFDPRIQLSEGASFDSNVGRRVFANSLGFVGSYRTSSCSLGRAGSRGGTATTAAATASSTPAAASMGNPPLAESRARRPAVTTEMG